ncbi:aldehyde dehydrogenase family protein [Thermocatellispora tengchongensis]|uniref:aldehyde dehydrogenase family protein n=1 Tax=Thermocatellispora tengchongensis TaxID=1073253 RepID=UPI003624EC66
MHRHGPEPLPRTGQATAGPAHTPAAAVAAAVASAAGAFPVVSTVTPAERRRWMEAVAGALEAHADGLVALAEEETALGEERLRGELLRGARNMRYYAAAGEGGAWLRARVQTVPGPPPVDLRRADLPIGPVAVFGASNFPFQFGVLGHDTCSALAAGCPVVVKAHPAHPRLSVRLAEIARAALAEAGAPSGTFSLVVGFEAGLALVDAPEIAAVAFTGSQAGGMALVERARRRPAPIPVYAEMGTVNPVLLTPAATAAPGRAGEIAAAFVESFTLGVGQYCTKPGLLLAPRGSGVVEAVAGRAAGARGGWLLTRGIAAAYADGLRALEAAGGEVLATGLGEDGGYSARPAVLRVAIGDLREGTPFTEECFGPVALVAEYDTLQEAYAALARLRPSLAGSVYGGGAADPDLAEAVARVAAQVGRVVVDGPCNGVVTEDAMHHGGPWPSTSDPRATSVGAEALARFTRPVAYQNVPDAALPPALRDSNPWRIPRCADSH